MSEAPEITKTFTIATPSEPVTWRDEPVKRDWMLSEVEDACWQARAAGAVDETHLTLGHDGIQIKDLPAFDIEIPAAMRRPATRTEIPDPPPAPPWDAPAPVVGLGRLARHRPVRPAATAGRSRLRLEPRMITADTLALAHIALAAKDHAIDTLRAELAATRIRLADRERELAAARLALSACADVRRERAAGLAEHVETERIV